jgi:type VI secretion system secreted protein VgrG
MPPSQENRLMKFTSPLGPDVLFIESLEGSEGISRLFDFQAELLADTDTTVNPAAIIGQKVTVELALLDAQASRYFNGLVIGFVQIAGDTEFNNYRAHIVPSLWQLTLSTNCRVFQDKTVMDIIKEVASTYGLSLADETDGNFKPLDYCTQYNETDFNFISRLAEQHGVFYWFEHTDSDNKVHFGNARTAYADCPEVSTVMYSPNADAGMDLYNSAIEEFTSTASMVIGSHTTTDYDYRTFKVVKEDALPTTSPFANNAYSNYYFPGGGAAYVKQMEKNLTDPQHAKSFLAAVAGASDAHAETLHGSSSARSFSSGYTFTMSDHPRDEWNRKYLLTELSHQVEQLPSYRSSDMGDGSGSYGNRFTAVSSDILYRPALVTPKPHIYGPQTGFVVTGGDDLHIDKMGRVCIQFWWDAARDGDTLDGTWVRVAQSWAGSGWGTYFWPRVKDEVIIQFLNGDPDNPIIVGSVYNGINVPKYPLPDMATRSGILTRSSQGGSEDTANELRFEDKTGAEQIFINAQFDMDTNVENDSREHVAANKSVLVDGDLMEEVGGDQHVTLKKNLKEKITADSNQDIGANHNVKVGSNYSLKVSGDHGEETGTFAMKADQTVYIKAGMTLVLEAGMQLSLKAGGNFIDIGPAGVAISGTMVLINSGGAAGSGSPPSITAPAPPTEPDKADDGTKGTKM